VVEPCSILFIAVFFIFHLQLWWEHAAVPEAEEVKEDELRCERGDDVRKRSMQGSTMASLIERLTHTGGY